MIEARVRRMVAGRRFDGREISDRLCRAAVDLARWCDAAEGDRRRNGRRLLVEVLANLTGPDGGPPGWAEVHRVRHEARRCGFPDEYEAMPSLRGVPALAGRSDGPPPSPPFTSW